MATPEQEGSAAGSPQTTPVPEEMDFDLFGPGPGSPSAQPATASSQPGSASTSAQVLVSGSVPTPGAPVQLPVPPTPTLGGGPTAAVDVADAEQPEHSVAATAESDELSDASSECSVDSFEPSFGRGRSQTKSRRSSAHGVSRPFCCCKWFRSNGACWVACSTSECTCKYCDWFWRLFEFWWSCR